MKKYFILLLLLCVLITCSACQNPIIVERRPCSQPNTKWISEDKTIVFTVDANNCSTGKIFLADETIEFYMTNDMGAGMHIFPIDVLKNMVIDTNDEYEYWLCSYKSKGKFIATIEKTTYFEVGEKIVFYRIEDENTGDGSMCSRS